MPYSEDMPATPAQRVSRLLLEFANSALYAFARIERRTEPFWRPRANALLREPLAAFFEALINAKRPREGLALAQERVRPGEDAALDKIIQDMAAYMLRRFRPGEFERAGNTKTHGIVRAEVEIRDDIPVELRQGLFREPKTYRAWVRFSGPGPDTPPDIDDVGFMSMTVKVMGVAGPKLLEDEKATQDFLAVCTPTFVSPDVFENSKLHIQSLRRTPLLYFFKPGDSHILDFLMQSLWTETQTSPLECQYYSCVPYLLGEGRAMKYSMRPRDPSKSRVPDLPARPPDNYLRDNMAATLAQKDVLFDLLIQVQTDAHAMPIEHAGVRWSSPYIPVATIRIPKQVFTSAAQLRFADRLSYTPWHCLAEHRPLGSLNRARKRMYWELSRLRFGKNHVAHVEPTGDEVFDDEQLQGEARAPAAARAASKSRRMADV